MNFFLKRKLRKLGNRANPRAVFVKQLENTLRHDLGLTPVSRNWTSFAVAVSTACVVLFSSTGAYAYASEEVTPEHSLYPVRIALEQFEEDINVTESAKTEVRFKHLEKRLQEARKLEQQKRPQAEARLLKITTKIEKAVEKAEKLSEKTKQKIEQRLTKIQEKNIEVLREARQQVRDQRQQQRLDQVIKKQQEKIEARVKRIDTKLEKKSIRRLRM